MSVWQRFAPYIFLVVAVFAVYSNIYDNAFVFDDDLLIHLNSYLRSWDTFGHLFTASTTDGAHIAGGFYRPVQNILYFFVFQIWGEQPFGFHLLNICIHAANACLAYRLALRLKLEPNAALFAMLIWALHPLHTEAVTYMSGTADPLFVMFCLLGLNVIFPNATQRHIWFSIPFFALGLLSKETAVVFPALAVVCLYFTAETKQKLKLRNYIKTWPLWLIACAYLAWRVNSTGFDGPARYVQLLQMPAYATMKYYSEHPFVRLITFFATLPAYAQIILWPSGLHMERAFSLYEDPLSVQVLGGIAMSLIAVAVVIASTRHKNLQPLGWGLLWFGAAHAPNSGILFSINSLFLEHWMYLPTIGLFLGVSQAVTPIIKSIKKPAISTSVQSLAVGVIALLSAATYAQNKIWHDPITFYTNIFSHGVISPRAHNNLAIAYMQANDMPKAIEEYRRAVAEGDTYAETHFNLAIALLALPNQKEQIPQAIAELERSIAIEPGFYRSYLALGQIYAQLGEKTKSTMYLQKANDLMKH